MKLDKLGLPEVLLSSVKQAAREAKEDHFFVARTIDLDHEPVEVYLGFQEHSIGHWVPDLLGLSLQRDRNNAMHENTFFLLPDKEFSVKEAYNMMKGRAVHRSAGEEDYWMKLNTQRLFHGITMPEMLRSDLNVGRWLEGSPLAERLDAGQKKEVVSALEAGERVDLGVLLGRKERGLYLHTNPEANKVEVRDGNRQVLNMKDVIQQPSPTLSHRK